jgi:putative membrane-bound dehydrogenase-like protein
MRIIQLSTLAIATGSTLVLATLAAADPQGGFKPAPAASTPNPGLKPFEYIEAPDKLPNYVPSKQWGTQGAPITTMQKPLDPDESLKHYVLPAGFVARPFAHEPDIYKPIYMAWDARGRLWISETRDYPNEIQPEGSGRDQIKICEDTDGDGVADKFTVFADKLSIATTFAFANGGIVVMQAGETIFLKDNDGDDKADERRVLFKGWGMGDTHATASNLRTGPDGWLWGVVGYSGFRGTVGGRDLSFGQGFFRMKPDGSALEFVRSSNNNTWGLAFDENGIVFGSTANGNAYMYMPVANRYYEAVNGWSVSRVESIADNQSIFPITQKVRQVDQHGRYTAGAGAALYTARSFPREYWNRVGFVCEPTGHLIGQFGLEPKGADFVAHNLKNFMASDDEWTSPITAEVGPDGALWVTDWYNYIIQHNPVPQGFKNGKGGAYETTLRDKTHGRIYRILPADFKPAAQPPRLDKASPDVLVASLRNENLLWRTHAQRLLIERAQADVVPALVQLVADQSLDSIGLNTAANHALWTLQGLGALNDPASEAFKTAVKALKHPAAGVRRAAASALPHLDAARDAILAAGSLNDTDAQVKLAALLALAETPPSDPAGAAIFAALVRDAAAADKWLVDGAIAAGATHANGFLKAALLAPMSGDSIPGAIAEAVRLVAGHFASGASADSVLALLAAAPMASPATAEPVLDGLARNWPKEKLPSLNPAQEKNLVSLMDALPEETRTSLLGLVDAWKRKDLFAGLIEKLTRELSAKVTNVTLADNVRTRAATSLVGFDDTEASLKTIVAQINLQSSPELVNGLIRSFGKSRIDPAADILIGVWDRLTPGSRRSVILTLTRRPEWTMALLNDVKSGKLIRSDIPTEIWGQLRRSKSQAIAALARELDQVRVSSDMEATLARIRPLAEQTGDVVNGKAVFTKNCAVCHALGGVGASIGPDLTGIGARAKLDFYVDIIDPNRSVEANFRLWTATTKDDESVSGRLESESKTGIEILDLAGQKHLIQRKDIKTLDVSPLSIMPVGFENLPAKDLTDLFEYMAASKVKP